MGITKLKDLLWAQITDERNRIDTDPITHRPLDGHHRVREEDEFIFENVPTVSDDEAEDFEEDFDDDMIFDDTDWIDVDD